MSELRKENKDLKQDNKRLRQENHTLKQDNKALKRELEQAKTKKNSSNSHIPPSQDIAQKNRSLRQKSSRKPGGQTGHEGHTLKMVDTPDEVKDYRPNYCEGCGMDLSQTPAVLLGSRQTIEIPPIAPIIVQHNVYSKVCNGG